MLDLTLPSLLLQPDRFTVEDTEDLLLQLLSDRQGHSLDWSTSELAASIMESTGGHRGLTGVCLAAIDDMIRSAGAISQSSWAKTEAELPFLLGSGGIGTYSALVADLILVQDNPGIQDVMKVMLSNAGQYYTCSNVPIEGFSLICLFCAGEYTLGPDELRSPTGELAWQSLVWSGIAIGPDRSGVISISSPLLLRALIIAATDSRVLPTISPFPTTLSSR